MSARRGSSDGAARCREPDGAHSHVCARHAEAKTREDSARRQYPGYQGVQNFAVYSAAKAYVLRLGEALHRELKRDGITVTTLCPGMSDTGFAAAAQQKITPALKLLMMRPAFVVRAGIRALRVGRISVVSGWANKVSVIFMWATPAGCTKPFSPAS